MFVTGNLDYHCYDGYRLWASKNNRVLVSLDEGTTWSLFANVCNDLRTLCPVYNRLMRTGIHNVLPIDEETAVVVVKGSLLVFHRGKMSSQQSINRGSRPLRQGIVMTGGRILYGDYWSNPSGEPVTIWCFDARIGDNTALFSINHKRHIHFVQQDLVNENCIFVGTGDSDSQASVYSYNLETGILATLGSGSQAWRAVSLLQKQDFLYWGSDCASQQNYIYRYNRTTGCLDRVWPIAGPAYYSAMNKEGRMFVATTIEQVGLHRAVIYSSSDGQDWAEEAEWRKDWLPSKLFGYGTIEFIQGQQYLERVFINLKGLKRKVR